MKLLFTDLDGTLLNDEKCISSTLSERLLAFLQQGNCLILTSGRPLLSIFEVKEKLQLPDQGVYISAFNGTLMYDCSLHEIIHEERLDITTLRPLLDKAYSLGIHCHTYDETHIVSEKQTVALTRYQTHIHLPARFVSDMTLELAHAPYKLITIHFENHQALEALQAFVYDYYGNAFSCLFSNEYYLEIFSAKGGKGNSIRHLCNYLKIASGNKDILAVGDASNDLPMRDATDIFFAMQNAEEQVKAVADYITTNDNNNDGVLDVLKLCNLPQ